MKCRRWVLFLSCLLLCPVIEAKAALYFWDNGGGGGLFSNSLNWNPDGNPGAADLAVHNSTALPSIQVNGNWDIDSLRLSDGGKVSHSSGTLTVANGVGPDNGLWVGEFGPNSTSYTLNGANAVIQINDPNDGFMVGRGGGSAATFTFVSGTVNNTVGDTHIGLDGVATWTQSGGTFNGAGVQIGRFASPSATTLLGGSATWNVGLVLLADGHGVFNPRNSGPVDLLVVGPNVNFNSQGLVMQDEGNLTFNAANVGISTLDLGGGQLLLNNGELFISNLPAPSGLGQVMVLLDNIGSFTGSDLQFDNAPDGTIYGGAWELDYDVPGQIRLVGPVPEPSTLMGLATALTVVVGFTRKSRS